MSILQDSEWVWYFSFSEVWAIAWQNRLSIFIKSYRLNRFSDNENNHIFSPSKHQPQLSCTPSVHCDSLLLASLCSGSQWTSTCSCEMVPSFRRATDHRLAEGHCPWDGDPKRPRGALQSWGQNWRPGRIKLISRAFFPFWNRGFIQGDLLLFKAEPPF